MVWHRGHGARRPRRSCFVDTCAPRRSHGREGRRRRRRRGPRIGRSRHDRYPPSRGLSRMRPLGRLRTRFEPRRAGEWRSRCRPPDLVGLRLASSRPASGPSGSGSFVGRSAPSPWRGIAPRSLTQRPEPVSILILDGLGEPRPRYVSNGPVAAEKPRAVGVALRRWPLGFDPRRARGAVSSPRAEHGLVAAEKPRAVGVALRSRPRRVVAPERDLGFAACCKGLARRRPSSRRQGRDVKAARRARPGASARRRSSAPPDRRALRDPRACT